MKKNISTLFFLIFCLTLSAQEKIYIHKSDKVTLGAPIAETDSIYFNQDRTITYFKVGDTVAQYLVSEIDSLSFGASSSTVLIDYNGSAVSIVNPLAFEGVSVAVDGADVTVTSSISDEISYQLSGQSSDGMLKIYSDKKYKLVFSGVSLTNSDGPAINIQSKKKCTVKLEAGTANYLTDGSTYTASTEDQKGAFFSEGQLEFTGTGSLSVKSYSYHAICSDDYINITEGTITVTGAGKDGIHSKDYFKASGGTVNVTSTGDNIQCEEGYIQISGGNITTQNSTADSNGITCDSTLTISGGTILVTISGNQSKGIKSDRLMTLSGGDITVNTSGGVVLEASGSGYDPAYCTAIKCDEDVEISGSKVTIKSTGAGGKGISTDGNIVMTSGTVNITTSGNGSTYKNSSAVTDSYNATCLTSDGNINLLGGSMTVSSSGTGGKGITTDGSLSIGDATNSPTINVTTSGTKFTESGSGQNVEYNEPKAIKSDGAVTINNGITTISSNDDGIKSETSITINNGTVSLTKSVEGMEAPYITVNNGNISLYASDDGFNATKGNGGESNDGSCIYLNGGNIMISVSGGDGLDSNGNMVMTGGTVIVHGPQSQPEVGMDFNGTFNISGGLLAVSGTNSNMTEGPSNTSSQYSVIAKTNSALSSSTLFHIQDASGNDIVTFKPLRSYYSVIFSSSTLKSGSTYYIYTGGSSTETNTNGLYTGGTYSGGTQKKSFTISGKVTTVSF